MTHNKLCPHSIQTNVLILSTKYKNIILFHLNIIQNKTIVRLKYKLKANEMSIQKKTLQIILCSLHVAHEKSDC